MKTSLILLTLFVFLTSCEPAPPLQEVNEIEGTFKFHLLEENGIDITHQHEHKEYVFHPKNVLEYFHHDEEMNSSTRISGGSYRIFVNDDEDCPKPDYISINISIPGESFKIENFRILGSQIKGETSLGNRIILQQID